MEWRKTLDGVRRRLLPVLLVIISTAAIVAVLWLAPNRTAAVVLGLFAAGLVSLMLLRRMSISAQTAALWFAIGVTADAAYAKLNDLAPVTVAGALMKVADATVKLGDTLVRGVTPLPADARAKIGAVTPDFIWALILGVILVAAWNRLFRSAPGGRR